MLPAPSPTGLPKHGTAPASSLQRGISCRVEAIPTTAAKETGSNAEDTQQKPEQLEKITLFTDMRWPFVRA
jgi:hypothetical protein